MLCPVKCEPYFSGGYKRLGAEMSFAASGSPPARRDSALSKSLENNRSLKMLERINKVVNWRNIDALLKEHNEVGTSKEGADAYPPLMLLKCMLLQKWFRIPSDPELENQINDRISFKKFLGLSLYKSTARNLDGEPSPDHSTFSRFRARVSKEAMMRSKS
ncbi:MAG: transposase [Deltaproteobacteria bacterium]|nr:transposase [Deltaproteobacteria bacterium]